MSYIQSTIRCDSCEKEMNVAFGIVGTQTIAEWPMKCPACGGLAFTHLTHGWHANEQVAALPPDQEPSKERG